MPKFLSREEWDLLREVSRLADEGLDQTQIAARLGTPLPTLRYRVGRLGFRLGTETTTFVRSAWNEKPFAELVENGEIAVGEPSGETAEVAA